MYCMKHNQVSDNKLNSKITNKCIKQYSHDITNFMVEKNILAFQNQRLMLIMYYSQASATQVMLHDPHQMKSQKPIVATTFQGSIWQHREGRTSSSGLFHVSLRMIYVDHLLVAVPILMLITKILSKLVTNIDQLFFNIELFRQVTRLSKQLRFKNLTCQ